jgi:hypothetical protein
MGRDPWSYRYDQGAIQETYWQLILFRSAWASGGIGPCAPCLAEILKSEVVGAD